MGHLAKESNNLTTSACLTHYPGIHASAGEKVGTNTRRLWRITLPAEADNHGGGQCRLDD
jgi:hypothetical protein